MRASMSIRGLWYYDKTIFDKLELPKDVDKDFLTNNLLIELDELEVLYPDPRVIKDTIGYWSHIQCPIWQKLVETTQYDYNPIHNYDRHEEYLDEYGEGVKSNHSINRSGNNSTSGKSNSFTDTDTTNNNTQTTTPGRTETTSNYVTGYNSALETLHDKSVINMSGNDKIVDNGSGTSDTDYNESHSDTGEYTDKETGDNSQTKNGHTKHTAHLCGNIGVTTTQQMIENEREVVKFNIYDYIIKDFKNRFCVMLY